MTQVASHHEEFQELEANVILISFEGRQFAGPWLREMDVPFAMLIDETRDAYEAYGLDRSFLRSWGLKNLWYYAKALWRGEELNRASGDTTQLGGDFIVDANGTVRLAYRSQDPTDRPPAEDLLDKLRGLANDD